MFEGGGTRVSRSKSVPTPSPSWADLTTFSAPPPAPDPLAGPRHVWGRPGVNFASATTPQGANHPHGSPLEGWSDGAGPRRRQKFTCIWLGSPPIAAWDGSLRPLYLSGGVNVSRRAPIQICRVRDSCYQLLRLFKSIYHRVSMGNSHVMARRHGEAPRGGPPHSEVVVCL